MALPTRTEVDSDITLTLVASPTSSLDVDSVATGGTIRVEGFSAGGEYMVYSKTSEGSTTHDAGYVDLRDGLENAGPATPLPDVGSVGDIDFAATTLDLVYVRGTRCYYLDLSGRVAAEPTPVNDKGTAEDCVFQRLAP